MSDFSLLIDGKLVAGDATMPILNPATEEVLAQCPRASVSQLNEAVAAAKAAFPAWSRTPIAERKAVLGQIADVIQANAAELARLLTQEQGKPIADATGEVYGASAFFRYFTMLDLPVKVIDDSPARKVEAHRRPLGVVGAGFNTRVLPAKSAAGTLNAIRIIGKFQGTIAPTTPSGRRCSSTFLCSLSSSTFTGRSSMVK